MKTIWKSLLGALVAALGMFGWVHAQVVTDTISWQWPTTRIDGTALPLSEIAKGTITVYPNATATTPTKTIDVLTAVTTTTNPRSGGGTGTLCYQMVVVDTGGLVSVPTGRGCKTVNSIPGTPLNFTVN